ncbi:MAG: CPBP family intramembrane metalloprotease [Chroococcidiopsidaceae cyanobacterium CP_BM_ER_R8_30]|nr:CPBP family intramembrane metalloprotease [Chroococcidiopsidaceae cyanobacterium CP_BM_ER_R8_30]
MKLSPLTLAQYPAPIRLGIFVLALLLVWAPLAVPIYWLVGDRNLVSILTMVLLYGEFLILVQFWGKRVYRQPQVLRSYGLQGTRRNAKELLSGLVLGVAVTLGLFGIEGWLGFLVWERSPVYLPMMVVEGLISALGIGLGEEFLFRGWLLDELQRDYRPRAALWANATLFALLHYIKPLPEIIRTWSGFPGKLLLGLTLVWAKRSSQGRLGLPIGLHAGLVWGYYIINVGQIVKYTGQVPDWVTGIDKNPLAGVVGLVFLSILAFWMNRRSRFLQSVEKF